MRKLAPLKVATIFLACLYDYGSRLVKVIDLGMPVVRIASDRRSNTLYAIGLPKRDFILLIISVPLKSGQININQTIPEKGKN